MKIAVLENESKKTISLFDQGFVTTYESDGGDWEIIDSFENTACGVTSISEVNAAITDIVERLGNVSVIVTSKISGIAISIFEDEGYRIFVADNNTMDFLDLVREQMIKYAEDQKNNSCQVDTEPCGCNESFCGEQNMTGGSDPCGGQCGGGEHSFCMEQFIEYRMDKGELSINMQAILLTNPSLTSRGLLLPYLRSGEFSSLDIICNHIPRWFDEELENLRLEYTTLSDSPEKTIVRIVHKQVQ